MKRETKAFEDVGKKIKGKPGSFESRWYPRKMEHIKSESCIIFEAFPPRFINISCNMLKHISLISTKDSYGSKEPVSNLLFLLLPTGNRFGHSAFSHFSVERKLAGVQLGNFTFWS